MLHVEPYKCGLFLACLGIKSDDDSCNWWWACWWEHTGRNIQYIILFSVDTKGHGIRGGHNGGYD